MHHTDIMETIMNKIKMHKCCDTATQLVIHVFFFFHIRMHVTKHSLMIQSFTGDENSKSDFLFRKYLGTF